LIIDNAVFYVDKEHVSHNCYLGSMEATDWDPPKLYIN